MEHESACTISDNLSKTGTEAGFKNTERQVEQVRVVMVVKDKGETGSTKQYRTKTAKLKQEARMKIQILPSTNV